MNDLRHISEADFSRVTAVFADVDGTLTTRGRIESHTLRALEALHSTGVRVVLVSGRSAGWAEAWVRQWPVAAAIAENGGLYFALRGRKLKKVYAERPSERLRNRVRLVRVVADAVAAVKGAKLSTDSAYTEVDLAIDHAEDVRLAPGTADKLEAYLHKRKVNAVRSSVHVNAWVGDFDKRSMVKRFLRDEWKTALRARDARFVFVGDSFNDEPMFEAFSLSVGVANVRTVLARLDFPPKFITTRSEGHGFVELANTILRARE